MNDKKIKASNCEDCENYIYDEEYECYSCAMNLDEDEMFNFIKGKNTNCPYYRTNDEYRIVRKQN